jgi:hypothetical protein
MMRRGAGGARDLSSFCARIVLVFYRMICLSFPGGMKLSRKYPYRNSPYLVIVKAGDAPVIAPWRQSNSRSKPSGAARTSS